MRKYLESLDEDGLSSVMEKLGTYIIIDNNVIIEMLDDGAQRSIERSRWKDVTIEHLLSTREKYKDTWNSLCFAVGIDPDDAVNISVVRNTQFVAWAALLLAMLSFIWPLVKYYLSNSVN